MRRASRGIFTLRLSRFAETAHTDNVPDDDDRPRDASSAADAGWSDPEQVNTAWAQVSAPDDISALSRDIHAYHRERRAASRRALIARVSSRRAAAPLTAIVVAIALAAIIATLLSLVGAGRGRQDIAPLPLATTSIPDGQVGGHVPAAFLKATKGPGVGSQTLRPAVIALLPPNCTCSPLVPSLARAASAQHVRLYAVAPLYPSADADSLAGQLDTDSVFYDLNGTLANTVRTDGLTLVLVNRNGTIYDITRKVTSTAGSGLTAALAKMLVPPPGTND
jgi:hypothetical protein